MLLQNNLSSSDKLGTHTFCQGAHTPDFQTEAAPAWDPNLCDDTEVRAGQPNTGRIQSPAMFEAFLMKLDDGCLPLSYLILWKAKNK